MIDEQTLNHLFHEIINIFLPKLKRAAADEDKHEFLLLFDLYKTKFNNVVTSQDADSKRFVASHLKLLSDVRDALDTAGKFLGLRPVLFGIPVEQPPERKVVPEDIWAVKGMAKEFERKKTARAVVAERPRTERRVREEPYQSRFASVPERQESRPVITHMAQPQAELETMTPERAEIFKNVIFNIATSRNVYQAQKDADFLLPLSPGERRNYPGLLSGLGAYAEQYLNQLEKFKAVMPYLSFLPPKVSEEVENAKTVLLTWARIFRKLLDAGIVPPTKRLDDLRIAIETRLAA